MSVITKELLRGSYRIRKALVTRLSRRYNHTSYNHKSYDCVQARPVSLPQRICVSWYNSMPVVEEEKPGANSSKIRYSSIVSEVYDFLKNSPHYCKTMMNTDITYGYVSMEAALELLERDWSCSESAELLEALKQLAYNVLSDHRVIPQASYTNIIAAVENNIKKFNVTDLVELLRYLIILEPRASSYISLRKALARNYNTFVTVRATIQQFLLLADALYQFNISYSMLMNEILHRIGRKPSKLSPKEIVQFCFLLSVSPRHNVNMYEVEYSVEQCLDEIGQTELGIICLGFFRSKNRFVNPELVERVLKKLIHNVDELNAYTLSAALKILRYSLPLTAKPLISNFMELLIPRISSLPLIAITHVSHMAANFGIVHDTLYKLIAERFMNFVGEARLKDIERIMYALSQMHECHRNSTVYKIAAYELLETYQNKRKHELKYYPLSIMRIITTLSYHNIYVPEIIKYVLDPNVVKKACKQMPRFTPYDYWYINNTLKLELPQYSGPYLEPEIHDYIMQKVEEDWDENRSHRLQTRIGGLICEIAEYCRKQLPPSTVYVGRLLPQYATISIVIGLGKHDYLRAEEILSAIPNESFKYVNTDELKETKWIAITPMYNGCIGSDNNFVTSNMIANIRHMHLLGYHTFMMTSNTFNNTLKSENCSLKDIIDKCEAPNLQEITNSRQIITKETLEV